MTLRLLLRGHDAKSIAFERGLSVHAVNERLRDARAKLGATSSQEAARLLAAADAADPHKLGDEPIGGAGAASVVAVAIVPAGRAADADPGPARLGAPAAMLIAALSATAVAMLAAQTWADAPSSVPRLTATQPTSGAAVRPGALAVRVTFEGPMRPDSFSFTTTHVAPLPAWAV